MARLTKVLNFLSQISFVSVCLSGCSGLEQSEQEKLRRMNTRGEFIHRTHDETYYTLQTPPQKKRELYPWEGAYAGAHSKISKEFFRCKGSSLNPPHADRKDPAHPLNVFDCGGFQKHSLPMRGEKEFVYPILVDLLNEVQAKTGGKVVITCGHRCPLHNTYADDSSYNQNSKHMIGAEVDFYVQGFESKPEEVIEVLMGHYKENPRYQKEKAYCEFARLETKDLNVSSQPWYNQEILIKLYKKHEGRDFDNRHPYPYISIQVRFDREQNEKVICSWQKAFNCYHRY